MNVILSDTRGTNTFDLEKIIHLELFHVKFNPNLKFIQTISQNLDS